MADAIPYLGEIRIWTGSFAPRSWLFCNGQILNIQQWSALFSLLGTTYGGNGQTTFGLPNLQGRIPMHVGLGHSQGEASGQESVTLAATQLPSHNHVPQASSAGTATTPAANVWAKSAAQQFAPAASPLSAMNAAALANTGSGQAHENMPPFQVVHFIICYEGAFPPTTPISNYQAASAFAGELRLVGFNYAPPGWAFCDGSSLLQSSYPTLFGVLGTTFGGDATNFNLPDLRGRLPFGAGTTLPFAQSGGAETHTLTTNEIPAHTHTAVGSSNVADQTSPANNYWGKSASFTSYASSSNEAMASAAVSATGGGLAHNNMPPYLTMYFLIALDDLVPMSP